MSQRRSSPCGLFSRAEAKLKLSDDEIDEAFTRSATVVERYFTGSTVLCVFCRIEPPLPSSRVCYDHYRLELVRRAQYDPSTRREGMNWPAFKAVIVVDVLDMKRLYSGRYSRCNCCHRLPLPHR